MDTFSNKSWAKYQKAFKALPEFEDCLNAFLDHAFSTVALDGTIYCPCKPCAKCFAHGRDIVYEHLKLIGMDKCYAQSRWVHHGEVEQNQSNKTSANIYVHGEASEGHDMQDMLEDAFGFHSPNGIGGQTQHQDGPNAEMKAFLKLVEDMNKPLFSRCEKISILSFIVLLYHAKCL